MNLPKKCLKAVPWLSNDTPQQAAESKATAGCSSPRFEIRPGTETLTVGGDVTLGGALDILAAPGLARGKTFTILNKTNPGAVSGTFAGKANGSVFRASGYNWRISYTGGDGNDVTLAVQ